MIKNLVLVLVFAAFWVSCSNNNEIPEENTGSGKISFITKVDNPVTTITSRAQSEWGKSGVPYVSKFVFYAFRQDGTDENDDNSVYKLEKIIKDTTDLHAVLGDGNIWSSTDESSLLPVGKYKFISLYNIGNATDNSGLETELLIGSIFEDAEKALIRQTNDTTDVNEIFCGITVTPVTVGLDNEAKVPVTLTRMVARVDVKFVKVSSDNKDIEIPYSGPNTIFGELKDSIAGITIDMNGLPSSLSFDKTKNDGFLNCSYKALVLDKLAFGRSSLTSTYPGGKTDFDADTSAIALNVIRGGAYLKGAYVLPFAPSGQMNCIVLTLKPKDTIKYSPRTITVNNTASFPLSLQANYVTLVTVKLVSTTDSGNPGGGDDDEHLFNPKTKLIVTIDKTWGGSIDVPVEVH